MNLLHILMGTSRGGCEGNALCLVQETKRLRHHVLVLGERGPVSVEFENAGAVVDHTGVLIRGSQPVVSTVHRAIQQSRPQAVIAWHGMVMLPEILNALHDFNGRVLVHGGNPTQSLPRSVDLRHLLREWYLGRRCDATYVCCSKYVADSFARSLYLRRFPRVVIPNGMKPLTVPPHTPQVIGVGKPFTIGMVARLDHIKDHPTLLRAFATLLKDWPSARLELAGDGSRRHELEIMAKDLGIATQVRFLGMVSDVYTAMQNWDMFAYATTEREGLGNALAEAMMFGLPCVVTEVGPMREVTGDGCSVRLVPKHDQVAFAFAVKELLFDYNGRRLLSFVARNRAQAEFNAQLYANRYLALLRT